MTTMMQVMIPEDVREQAQKVARKENVSLDEFTTLALIQRINTRILDPYLEERAKRGDPRKLKEALAMAPHVPPEEDDRLD